MKTDRAPRVDGNEDQSRAAGNGVSVADADDGHQHAEGEDVIGVPAVGYGVDGCELVVRFGFDDLPHVLLGDLQNLADGTGRIDDGDVGAAVEAANEAI